jgi:small-conductance mechanosensitive channel
MQSVFESIARFFNAGIAGSEITPFRLLVVLVLMSALVWATRKGTRLWLPGHPAGAGIDLTSLNVLVGAIGVGLGFGLQAVTSNFFSGLIILFERPIKIGQRIEIDGVVGQVREIAARATTPSPMRTSP